MGGSSSRAIIRVKGPRDAADNQPPWMQDEAQFIQFLEGHGVSTRRFGNGAAKSASALLQELRTGMSYLELLDSPAASSSDRTVQVLRIVEPVFIRLRWRSRVLVQEYEGLADGRRRHRHMLLAEKKAPGDGGGLLAVVIRALRDEFGISQELLQQDGILRYRADTYHFEIERLDSPSYPGLPSMYRTHHVQVDLLEGALEAFREFGLPEGSDFVTERETELGMTTHFWKWYDIFDALHQGVKKFPPQAFRQNPFIDCSEDEALLPPPPNNCLKNLTIEDDIPDVDALRGYLVRAGIDPSLYGVGKAKPLLSLLKEVKEGETLLEWNEDKCSLKRIVEPVFVQFRWGDRVLVEVEQRFISDGRKRQRNMLLAEKKAPEDTDVEATAIRGIFEELGLPTEVRNASNFRFMRESYCCVAENMESGSYPGLECLYVTHYCSVHLLDAGIQSLQVLGMLETSFETSEPDKLNIWRWDTLAHARESKVKGFPVLNSMDPLDDDSRRITWQKVEGVPRDLARLRVLLEMGGVKVSLWGEFVTVALQSLARELHEGVCHLERDVATGRLRRVLKSNMVHLSLDQAGGGLVDSARGDAHRDSKSFGWERTYDPEMQAVRRMVSFNDAVACFEVSHADTASYPGLPCSYQTQLVQFEKPDKGYNTRCAVQRTHSVELGQPRSHSRGDSRGTQDEQHDATRALTPVAASLSKRLSFRGQDRPRIMEEVLKLRKVSHSSAGLISEGEAQARTLSRQSLSSRSSTNISDDPKPRTSITEVLRDDDTCATHSVPRSLYGQLRSIHNNLRFRMVAKESLDAKPKPAEHVVACSCSILLIRNINPLNATFQCRFVVMLEWLDGAAIGWPEGKVPEELRSSLNTPEVALQNTLATSQEVHYAPEVVTSSNGHVACKVLFQAIMQMELNMRLFPFDTQRLVLVMGLRARRDRGRAVSCQFCHVDSQIKLDEWKLLSSFSHTDRPDGRARIQFGVLIGRAYWYYVLNVLVSLTVIATSVFAGYLLPVDDQFDRLRFGVAVLFAQTTFRLSIEGKLPKVAYATVFDNFAQFCQMLVMANLAGNVLVNFVPEHVARKIDLALAAAFGTAWVFGNVAFFIYVCQRRSATIQLQQTTSDQTGAESLALVSSMSMAAKEEELPEAVHDELASIKKNLRFHDRSFTRASATLIEAARAVSVSTRIWLLHDVDPILGTFECKFTVFIEWFDEKAVGFPEGVHLSKEQLAALHIPEVDVHNKVEMVTEAGPEVIVSSSARGQVVVTRRCHARLQLHLDLKRFPFDSQRLPLNITLPDDQDQNRAFVYRSCTLDPGALQMDEWTIQGYALSTDCLQGLPMASLEISIRRQSKFYVVSVMLVLLGISTLVFTVFVIRQDLEGVGFSDQGRILVPLLMTLLAFKLLTASGKIPKVAYATIFDRYILACEALFFFTTIATSFTQLLLMSPWTAAVSRQVSWAALYILGGGWFIFNLSILYVVLKPQPGRIVAQNSLGQVEDPRVARAGPAFEEVRNLLISRHSLGGRLSAILSQGASTSVLLSIHTQKITSLNAMTASFNCEFTVFMAWQSAKACGLPDNRRINPADLHKLQKPVLLIQNALTCKIKTGRARVLCGHTGTVGCELHVTARLQINLKMDMFPFDEQVLTVVLALPEPQDSHRNLILEQYNMAGSVKLGEWTLLDSVSATGRREGVPRAVFGVRVQRIRRYYVASLVSLVLWSAFGFTVYAIDAEQFNDRGKVLVGVLLVQVVAKLAVSSKLPRIARITAYDRVALHSLNMCFGIGCSAAIMSKLTQLGLPGVSRLAIVYCDWGIGATLFIVWLVSNIKTAFAVRAELRRARRIPPGTLPAGLEPLPNPEEHDLEVLNVDEDLADMSLLFHNFLEKVRGTRGSSKEDTRGSRVASKEAIQTTVRAPTAASAVSIGVKVWIVSDVDPSSSTFEVKFHMFVDWFDDAAVGMQPLSRIGSAAAPFGPEGRRVRLPHVIVSNAVSIMVENRSEAQVVDGTTGQVSCRIHYHARVYNTFDLRSFPCDCQMLEVALDLKYAKDQYLIQSFCEIDDQTSNLDGWRMDSCALTRDPDAGLQRLNISILVERESRYFVKHVLVIFFFLTSLMFSFYLLRADELAKRVVDGLKIVLTQTTFRFSVEHRLPKVAHWTPFDVYLASCQAVCTIILLSFILSEVIVRRTIATNCEIHEWEKQGLLSLGVIWLLWNVGMGTYAFWLDKAEVRRYQQRLADLDACQEMSAHGNDGEEDQAPTDGISQFWQLRHARGSIQANKPWEASPDVPAGPPVSTQVVSIAFRIWLIRNVDLVSGTFECKFRVFLEWLDESALGLPKGKKANLPVPKIMINNAIQWAELDRSSAPEVVNPGRGHLAAQILYRATLRINQEVRRFPFDSQWLAITVSLSDADTRGRSLWFQYCEVHESLKLNEWSVHPQPAFCTLSRQDGATMDDTVMCGVLIKRNSRYYVVNIMAMLFLISSLTFATYTISARQFWERAEIFLGIFPVIVIFKMSAQGKLPRVSYSTKFDIYASACQALFLTIVLGCMVTSFAANFLSWVSLSTCVFLDLDETVVLEVQQVEAYFMFILLFVWIVWHGHFWQHAWRATNTTPIQAIRTRAPLRLQDEAWLAKASGKEPDTEGLAKRLAMIAAKERKSFASL